MPSPFPGVAPYLEGSEWSSVHVALSAAAAWTAAHLCQAGIVTRIE